MSQYVCENCGRLGEIGGFNDDCRPGWTHGRLIEVPVEVVPKALADQLADALKQAEERLASIYDTASSSDAEEALAAYREQTG